ncbi:MAG: thioredoxin [Thermoprotei archaeon]
MLEVSSREELNRALRANDIVMIEYYDPESKKSREFNFVIKELVKYIDPRILVLRVNVKRAPELSSDVSTIPCLRVYYRGELIFEQQGYFGNVELDVYVLRRSIRSVFYDRNLKYRI